MSLHGSDYGLLWGFLIIFIILGYFVGRKASPDVELRKDAGYRRPMLAFELNAAKASDMFSSWDEKTKEKLKTGLLWDYLFIFIYPGTIAVACFIAGLFLDRKGIVPMNVTVIVMALQLIAAILDSTENFALLRVLQGSAFAWWPQIARWCALTKFGVCFLGLGYSVLLGGGALLVTFLSRA